MFICKLDLIYFLLSLNYLVSPMANKGVSDENIILYLQVFLLKFLIYSTIKTLAHNFEEKLFVNVWYIVRVDFHDLSFLFPCF